MQVTHLQPPISIPDQTDLKNNLISLKLLSGQQILPFISDIGQLILEVYKEWPYLYEGTLEEQYDYVQTRYINMPNSLVCTAFDQEKLVGLAMGVPLCEAPTHYLTPFTSNQECLELPLKNIFYWGELIVRSEYRQREIAQQMCDLVLKEILDNSDYKAIAFCTVERSDDFHLNNCKTNDYFSLDSKWEELGFKKHEDLSFNAVWRLVQESHESQHHMVYWVKKIDSF